MSSQAASAANLINNVFATNHPVVTLVLMGATSLFNSAAFILLLVYFCICFRKYHDLQQERAAYLSKAGVKASVKEFIMFCVNFVILVVEIISTIIVYLAALIPYNTLRVEADSTADQLYNWFEGTNTTLATAPVHPRELRVSMLFIAWTLITLLWSFFIPYVMTLAFRLAFGDATDYTNAANTKSKALRYFKIAFNFIWHKIRMIPGFVVSRLLIFLLGYFVKKIIVLFIYLPWEVSLKGNFLRYSWLFLIWSIILTILMMGCLTVQGVWIAFYRVIVSGRFEDNFKQIKNSFNEALTLKKIGNIFGFFFYLLLTVAKFLVFYVLHIVKHCIKTIVAFPEPRALSGKVYLCNNRKILYCCCELRGDDDHEYIDLMSWNGFCSSYTMIFILPIPFIGPYLWLVVAMLARSGFWLSPFWMWIARRMNTDYPATDVELTGGNQPPKAVDSVQYYSTIHEKKDRRDVVLNGFTKVFEPLPKAHEKFVNPSGDRGRLLRLMSIAAYAAIPLLVLWCVFQNGFDIPRFVLCFWRDWTKQNWNSCLDTQLDIYNKIALNTTQCYYKLP